MAMVREASGILQLLRATKLHPPRAPITHTTPVVLVAVVPAEAAVYVTDLTSVYLAAISCSLICMQDCLLKRHGLSSKIRYPAQLDKVRRRRILAFLMDNGWITGAS